MPDPALSSPFDEYANGAVWLKRYPVNYSGMTFSARTSLIRLRDGSVVVHSPCPIDDKVLKDVESIGPVRHIIAPGSFHYFYVADWQKSFPDAVTWICPGVERKRADLHFDWLLGDRSPAPWEDEIDQVLVRGTRFIWEVAFFHRDSRTLVLTDLIENIGDSTPGAQSFVLKLWWKAVFHMWNQAKPAPEYQWGWSDKVAARATLERILEWDFERVVIAHGDCIEKDAHAVLREAWKNPLAV